MENKSYNDFIPNIKYKKLSRKELKESIEQAKEGSEDHFEKILCHMHNYLTHLTKEFFIQGAESQDVYQEGAIKLKNVIEKFNREKGSFTTFAQSSIRKHIITMLNKEQAKKRQVLNQSYSLNNTASTEEGETVSFLEMLPNENTETTSEAGNPLDIIQKDYEEYLVQQICEVLSPMEGKVFVLRFIRGLSYKEVAKELNLYRKDKKGRQVLDQKSVDNAIWRSRPKIKRTLERLQIDAKKMEKGS